MTSQKVKKTEFIHRESPLPKKVLPDPIVSAIGDKGQGLNNGNLGDTTELKIDI